MLLHYLVKYLFVLINSNPSVLCHPIGMFVTIYTSCLWLQNA